MKTGKTLTMRKMVPEMEEMFHLAVVVAVLICCNILRNYVPSTEKKCIK